MEEYILYYRGKIVGGIYDDRLLVKPVPSAIARIPDAAYEAPYGGVRRNCFWWTQLTTGRFWPPFLRLCTRSFRRRNTGNEPPQAGSSVIMI